MAPVPLHSFCNFRACFDERFETSQRHGAAAMAPVGHTARCWGSRTALRLASVLQIAFWLLIVAPAAGQQVPPGAGGGSGGRRLQAAPSLPLDRIRLPPLFSIDLFVDASFPARFMELGQADVNTPVVYVSSTTDTVRRGSSRV